MFVNIQKGSAKTVDFKRLKVIRPQPFEGGLPHPVNGIIWGKANIKALANQFPHLIGKWGRGQGHACLVEDCQGGRKIVHPSELFQVTPIAAWVRASNPLDKGVDWLEENYRDFLAGRRV